jgi:H+/gluconate symporter-like permease
MDLLIVLGALVFLMFVAYRGYSVILFAPIAALGAVLLTEPSLVPPMFSSVFMDKMVGFVKSYFPVFMLGAVFGKVIELSGFSKSIVSAVIGVLGRERAVLSIVVVCALLTYGGVSLFVVVFAVYPFAAEMFRQSGIPKRLIPCTVALGAFTFTMDSMPGSPQIQNIIPTTFFKTTTWAAPWLGLIGSLFILGCGLAYIESRLRAARARGEGYGTELQNEPEPFEAEKLPNPWIASGGRRHCELLADAFDPSSLRRRASNHGWRQANHHANSRRVGDLGGRGSAAARDSDRIPVCLAPCSCEVCRRQQGCGWGSLAGVP